MNLSQLGLLLIVMGVVTAGMPQTDPDFGQGIVADSIPQINEDFHRCKAVLDREASHKCDFAGNIHICADMVGGELASQTKAELNRLGCDSKIETCGNTVFGKCVLYVEGCYGIRDLAMCFLRHDCATYDALLNKYCNHTCDVNEPGCGKTPTLSGTDRNKCMQLDRYILCMNEIDCSVSFDLKKYYRDIQCGKMCSGCYLEIRELTSKRVKCWLWSEHFTCLQEGKCEFLEKDIRDYKYLNCDEQCKYICGTGDFDMKKDRKEGCETISRYTSCMKSMKCPISQVIKDYSSNYGCDKSCNVDKLDSCRKNMVPIVNSTRDETCSLYRRYMDCIKTAKCENVTKIESYLKYLECDNSCNVDKLDSCRKNTVPNVNSTRDEAFSLYRRYMDCTKTAKCENDTNVELYFKDLECGAGNLSLLVVIMISVVVSFQMLDTYFGNY